VTARILVIALALAACGSPSKPPPAAPSKRPRPAAAGIQYGYATWYGGKHHGGPTASGERFDKRALTAAHRTLRMHTRVKVTNRNNGRSVVLRINDRGPYGNAKRIIDVSERAAEILDMIEAGVVPVSVEVLK